MLLNVFFLLATDLQENGKECDTFKAWDQSTNIIYTPSLPNKLKENLKLQIKHRTCMIIRVFSHGLSEYINLHIAKKYCIGDLRAPTLRVSQRISIQYKKKKNEKRKKI